MTNKNKYALSVILLVSTLAFQAPANAMFGEDDDKDTKIQNTTINKKIIKVTLIINDNTNNTNVAPIKLMLTAVDVVNDDITNATPNNSDDEEAINPTNN